MGFKLGDIVVDRIQLGIATNYDDEIQYVLTQLTDATLETSAESKDAVDKDGTLIKRFWTGKTGTFTATNALLNMNIIGAQSGSGSEIATEANPIIMPKMVTVNAAATGATTVTLSKYDEGGVSVIAADGSGNTADDKYALSGVDTAHTLTITPGEDGDFTLRIPAAAEGSGISQYFIKYNRIVKSGTVVSNYADQFPKTVRLYLKVLAVDPCHADTVKAAIIEMPSFQPSPETSISLTTDGQLDFSGDLQVDYCSTDKCLYKFYWADLDEE